MPRETDSNKKAPKKKATVLGDSSVSKEKTPKTPKKSVTAKPSKVSFAKEVSPAKGTGMGNRINENDSANRSLLIYNHSKFNEHPTLPDMDLIKILVRSPKEIYVFWKLDPNTFLKTEGDGGSDPVQFSLKIRYQTARGDWEEVWYELLPFTESYYCKFPYPIFEIEASLFARSAGFSKQILHTKDGDLPPSIESLTFDRQWIHPNWIQSGLVTVDTWGNLLMDEQTGVAPNQNNLEKTFLGELPSSHSKANSK